MNKCDQNTELSSPEGTRSEVNRGTGTIKLGIDVHQHFYVVVMQLGGGTPKPPQRFAPPAFLHWVAKLRAQGHRIHAVYEACGFGFGLYRELTRLGIECVVCCPQKLDERNKRMKTDGPDAKALCLKLDRYVEGNRDALAVVRVPTEEAERLRTIHRQREQLLTARKQLEAQGRSLLVNFGFEATSHWWKPRLWARMQKELPAWIMERLAVSQPVIALLDEQIKALTSQLQQSAPAGVPKGVGALTSVVIEREIGDWHRFRNRRQVASYTGMCPGEYIVAAAAACRAVSPSTGIRDCGAIWSNSPGGWCASSPITSRCGSGKPCFPRERPPREQRARKPSWPWPGSWLWTCGACAPGA
jgi:transposase